jgi:Tfp pilus assembly protein PilF
MRRPARLIVATLLAVAAAGGAEMRVLEDDSPAKATSLGNEALMDGRFETAAAHYLRALQRDPRYFFALFNLALAHQRLGQMVDARKRYEQALALEPDNAQVLCNLGWLDFHEGGHEDAARRFADAARLAAGRPSEAAEYWFDIGAVREKQARHAEARRAYEQALAADERHYGARYNLGTLYLGPLHAGPASLALAREHLEKATALEPKRMEAWLNLALCRERQGDAGAEAAYDRAVASAQPGQGALARWRRALWYDRLVPSRKIAMRDDLKAVLAAEPDFPDANGRLGAYYHAIGDYDLAIIHLEREVAEANDRRSAVDVESHFLLAEIFTDHRPQPQKALFHATACQQAGEQTARVKDLHRRLDQALAPVEPTAPPRDEADDAEDRAHAPAGRAPAPHPHPAEAAHAPAHAADHHGAH